MIIEPKRLKKNKVIDPEYSAVNECMGPSQFYVAEVIEIKTLPNFLIEIKMYRHMQPMQNDSVSPITY